MQVPRSYSKINQILQPSSSLLRDSPGRRRRSRSRRCQAQPSSKTADCGKCNSLASPWASLYMCSAQRKTSFIF